MYIGLEKFDFLRAERTLVDGVIVLAEPLSWQGEGGGGDRLVGHK